MVNSHNNSYNSSSKLLIRYLFSKIVYSVIVTVFMIFLTYKDIIYFRFMSSTVGGSYNSTFNFQNLLFDRFSYILNTSLSKNIPVFLFVVMVFMIIYSMYFSYKKTYFDLSTNQNNVHIKQRAPLWILIKSILTRSSIFVIPLLYWFYYIFIWFPYIVKAPLAHILKGQIIPSITYTSAMLFSMVFLTQIGLVISTTAITYLKKT